MTLPTSTALPSSTGRKVLTDGVIYAGTSGIANAMRFLLLPLLTRGLTPSDYGAYAIALSIVTFGTMIATLGLDAAVARAWYDRADAGEFRSLAARITALGALINVVWVGLATLALAAALPRLMPESAPRLLDVRWSLAALVFVYPFVSIGTSALQAQRRPFAFGAIQSLRAAFVLVFVTFCFYTGRLSLSNVLLAEIIAVGASGALAVVMAYGPRDQGGAPTSDPNRISTLGRAFRYALPVVPASASNWAMAVSDRIVLAHYFAPAVIAVYGVGYNVPLVLSFIMTAANAAYVPHFFAYAPSDDQAGTVLRRDSLFFAYTFGTLALAVALLAPEIVTVVAGAKYAESASVTRIVVFALYVQGFYLLASLPIYLRRRTSVLPWIAAAAAASNIALNLLLAPRFGMIAAAWTTLEAYLVLAVGVTLFARRLYAYQPVNGQTLSIASVVGLMIIAGANLSLPLRAAFIGVAAMFAANRVLHISRHSNV